MKNIFVLGAGTMGAGIAQVAATAGYDVVLMDISQEQLVMAKKAIKKSIDRLLNKGRITDNQYKAADEIKVASSYELIRIADLVIESVSEDPEMKMKIFTDIDQRAPSQAILASNTSSISITKLGASTKRPEMVIGMHFMNPVPLMKLVEVVPSLDTNQETMDTIFDVCRSMGKEPIEAKDSPGFISNRILCPMINEAIFALQEGVGKPEDIDKIMKLGMNHPMGPLELCDLIGLDIVLHVMEVLQQDLGEDKYRPAYLLRKMVAAGHLGRKTKRGFYYY